MLRVLQEIFGDSKVHFEDPHRDPLDPNDVTVRVIFRMKLPAPKHLPSAQGPAVDFIAKHAATELRMLLNRLVTVYELDNIRAAQKELLIGKLQRWAELVETKDSARAYLALQLAVWLRDGQIDKHIAQWEEEARTK